LIDQGGKPRHLDVVVRFGPGDDTDVTGELLFQQAGRLRLDTAELLTFLGASQQDKWAELVPRKAARTSRRASSSGDWQTT
jgi:hypothetical protein